MTTAPSATSIPYVDVNEGHHIPQLGFGVFQVPPPDTADVVRHALATGYRSIDTGAMYGNEASVGEAVAHTIAQLDSEDGRIGPTRRRSDESCLGLVHVAGNSGRNWRVAGRD